MTTLPDYTPIDSAEKAQALYQNKELVKVHLMPLDWGGEDVALNILYVPAFAFEEKCKIDGMIEDFLIAGLNIRYAAVPEYKGRSFIPSRLVISYSGDMESSHTISIW